MEPAHPLGTVVALWRYPTKSLRFEALERTEIGERGLPGDRSGALFVASPDHARSGKTFRGKEHHLLHTVTGPQEAISLAARGGVQLEERVDGPFFDSRPVSLIFDRWLAELEAGLGMQLDPLRFRPNIFVRAAGEVANESALVGRTLRVGEVELRVVEPINRCVTPSYGVESGERQPHLQRAIVEMRNNVMGVYCTVERTGIVALGDAILSTSGEIA